MDNFNFLKNLNVPQKLVFSHSVVSILLKFDQIDNNYDADELTTEKQLLEIEIQKLAAQEEAFQIAKTEYEKKEERFVNLILYSPTKLDKYYFNKGLIFRDVDKEGMMNAIKTQKLKIIITEVIKNKEIILEGIQICYKRIEILKQKWNASSKNLLEQINNFEQRGFKLISNNLRLKLLPELKEMKSTLKSKIVEGSSSRIEIQKKLKDMVEQAKEDIFGDLTESQIKLLNELTPSIEINEIRNIISDDTLREDFLELIETKKIRIKITKVIDRII